MATAENLIEDTAGRATHQFARFLANENLIKDLPQLRDYGEGLQRRIGDMRAGRSSTARLKCANGLTLRRPPSNALGRTGATRYGLRPSSWSRTALAMSSVRLTSNRTQRP